MAEEVRLWQVDDQGKLQLCKLASLTEEKQLEGWVTADISILDSDLLVIGRQVPTDFGGFIDLLCMNPNGDLVIVELKRDKTPRQVTAQALDYASWVVDLDSDRINQIAAKFLKSEASLEETFQNKFDEPLPEILNENHRMIIVGSKIDPETERIVTYLSNSYGVDINAVTFQFFRTPTGQEMLTRFFLIEPEKASYQARTKRTSKRRPYLTYEQLEGLAEENGVIDLCQHIVPKLSDLLPRHTTRSSIVFDRDLDGSRRAMISFVPAKSSQEQGLYFQIYYLRLCEYFGFDKEEAISLLPNNRNDWIFPSTTDPYWSGYDGYFQNIEEIEILIEGLSKR